MHERDAFARLLSPMTAQSLVAVVASRAAPAMPDLFRARGGYVKIASMGQVGWLPRGNLAAAMVIDPELLLVD